MKKTLKLFAMLLLASALGMSFASCEKEPATTTVESAALTANDLAGTVWRCLIEHSYVQQGVTVNFTLECLLNFIDSEKGVYTERGFIELPDYPDYNQEAETEFDFNYAVDGDKIRVVIAMTDSETGEEIIDEVEYTYEADTQRIVLDTDNADMERMMGTDTYIFTRI